MPEVNYLNLNWKEGLTKLLPVTAVLLTAIYLIGFIIVSSYLDKFGIRSTEIFQFRYLSIGIIFLVIFAVNAVIYFRSLRADLTVKGETLIGLLRRWFNDLIIFIWINAAISFLIFRGTPSELLMKNPGLTTLAVIALIIFMEIHFKEIIEWIRDLAVVFLFIMIARLFGLPHFLSVLAVPFWLQFIFLCTFDVEHAKLLKKFDSAGKQFFWGIKSALLLVGVLIGCYHFGYSLYGKVPRYFGGGEPLVVQLAIPDDDVGLFNRLGIGTEGKGLTPPLSLIHETDTEYYVLTSTSSKKPNAIGIPKKIVKGIILSR